jgi:Lrp/AsnC family transcriptional regulator for asnA, asnC and gidA
MPVSTAHGDIDNGIRGFSVIEMRILSIVVLPSRASLVKMTDVSPDSRRNGTPPSIALDDLSKAIIEQLQQDGRRAYATIGKAVGLSEAAVRQRVQKLTDSGVMQIVAVTDPLQVGFHRQAMIGIRCDGSYLPVAEALAAMDEVDYVVATAGSFDLIIEVVAEDDDQLLDIINNRVRAIPQVRSTESFVYLKLHKQTYTWGTR